MVIKSLEFIKECFAKFIRNFWSLLLKLCLTIKVCFYTDFLLELNRL